MTVVTWILVVIIFTILGFIFGALVYRNNTKQLNELTDTVIKLADQVKGLKK